MRRIVTRKSIPSSLGLSCVLSGLFLVVSLGSIATNYLTGFAGNKVSYSILETSLIGTTLGYQIALFALAQLTLHVGMAVFVWMLALLVEVAFRPFPIPRSSLVLGWFAVISAWILLANATLFPLTFVGQAYSFLVFNVIAGISAFEIFTAIILCIIFALCLLALMSIFKRNFAMALILTTSVACVLVLAVVTRATQKPVSPIRPQHGQPDIIIIGIDSLRNDLISTGTGRSLAPHINEFIDSAFRFSDTTTPVARTFPSWISLLTGRHPVKTGVRFNLTPRYRIQATSTLPDRLVAMGYKTIYATDEVRFANIDRSFGFQQTITPRIGASDFILGTFNDLPLANIISNTRLSREIFPNTYANRAAAATYHPQTFLRLLKSELEPDGPTFLAVHFTLAHFPYKWSGATEHKSLNSSNHNAHSTAYFASVQAVDKQFDEFLHLLRGKHLLDNAIVLVISDHGEALGRPADDLLYEFNRGQSAKIPVSTFSHGTSVLSPHQYHTLLGFRFFGLANPKRFEAGTSQLPASMEDVTPTILELLGGTAGKAQFDGISLAPIIRGEETTLADSIRGRFRFTETGFNVPSLLAGVTDEDELLKEARVFYRIDAASGRLELRTDLWPALLGQKERAVIHSNRLLAALPLPNRQCHRYLLIELKDGSTTPISHVPDEHADPELLQLWRALSERFPGELLPPHSEPVMQMGTLAK